MIMVLSIAGITLGASLVWVVSIFAYYQLCVRKTDTSGDLGLAFAAIALLPIFPFVWAYQTIFGKK